MPIKVPLYIPELKMVVYTNPDADINVIREKYLGKNTGKHTRPDRSAYQKEYQRKRKQQNQLL